MGILSYTLLVLILCLVLVSEGIEVYNLIQLVLFVSEWISDSLTPKSSHFILKCMLFYIKDSI